MTKPLDGHQWDAALIDGHWRVGMKGNLDTRHDSVLTVHTGIVSAERAEIIAKGIAEHQNTLLKNVGWVDMDEVDFYHFRSGDKVLAELRGGERVLVWWEDKVDYKDTCDTETLEPGWVTGDRNGPESENAGRYVVVEPIRVMAIPE